MRRNCLFLFSVFVLFILGQSPGICKEWSNITIRLLPDSSFASVEAETGKKIRHCPHHDMNGRLDEEQLIYVLGKFDDEKWLHSDNEQIARKHLESHYDKVMAGIMKKGLHNPVNINKAKLAELVALPHIGPVLAVKIVEYRTSISMFETIEQIKKVEGIGLGTFNAIKYYISVN